jgi:parallel beta-helix repeat protein
MLEDNKYNFCVRDDFPSDFMNSVDTFMNSVDTSNLVNGKPVCYMTSKSNLLISPENYPEIGYLALVNCTNIIVQGLTLTNNSNGILLAFTNNSKITNCTATNNEDGICLYCSSNNTVIGNNATANSIGIHVTFSNNNKMYSNNFNNKMYRDNLQVDSSNSTNMWDDGYPYGGNYWSDYSGIDADHDGIGDTPYVIDANNTDNYPLIGTYHEFTVTDGMLYNIATVSNFTILDLYSLHELRLDGSWYLVLEISAVLPKGTVGFCRIDIPRALIDGPYRVFTLGGNFTPTELPVSNSSHALLYFTFDHSGPVIIVPEFPSFLILPFFFIATLLAVIAHRRKHR